MVRFVILRENVRLGDYDLNLMRNCVGRNCGNPMRINEIDETIPHESFNHRAINRKHDIGLVRLKHSVQYTSKNFAFEYQKFALTFFASKASFDLFVFQLHHFQR